MRLAELEDRLEDLKEWVDGQGRWNWIVQRREAQRRRAAKLALGPKKLLEQAQAAKAGAEKALQDTKNEIANICKGVGLSDAQMAEELKKLNAIKAYEAAQAKVKTQTEVLAAKEAQVQKCAAKC